MDGIRRGTLLPHDMQNARSGLPMPSASIPMPSSAMKKLTPAARMRQSMAGPPPMVAKPNNPLYNSQTQNIMQSAQKNSMAFGRTPMRNSNVRGGGGWGPSGRQSMLPPTPGPASHALKDPRNIRDKAVQASMRNTIHEWLQETEFPGILSKQTLLSPTAKDFRQIFEHLVSLLDPATDLSFETGQGQNRDKNAKRFEDEVLLVLKSHHYPFADAIDKKWLAAPASMHSWPQLLACLHWLVGMSRAKLSYFESQDPTLQDVEQIPDDFDDPHHHAGLAFQFLNDAYGSFLSGVDDFSEQIQALEDKYAKKNESVTTELDTLRTQMHELNSEYHKLTDRPAPKVKLEEENRSLKQDKKKFDDVLQYYENRKRKVADAIRREQEEILEESSNLEKLRVEQERLAVVVREQNLTPEEVAQMTTEQETLSRALDELRRKSTETTNQVRSLEVALAKRSENVEQAVDEYMELLQQLALFPSVPEPLPYAGVDLRLEINFASQNPRELVRRTVDTSDRGTDPLGEVKGALDSIADYKRRQHMSIEDDAANLENELDDVVAETDRMEEEIDDLERKINNVQEEAEAIRITTQQEASASNSEAQRLQKELAYARSAALASGVGVKSRLQALQIAYQEQVERVERLKDETIRNILKSSSDIATFREEVSKNLMSLRRCAEQRGD